MKRTISILFLLAALAATPGTSHASSGTAGPSPLMSLSGIAALGLGALISRNRPRF